MSAKNRDEHNRFRNITVGFRVSPEENEQINIAVALSGLPKQEYCYRRCLNRDIVVQGNPKVYKALRTQLAAVLDECLDPLVLHIALAVVQILQPAIVAALRHVQNLNQYHFSLPSSNQCFVTAIGNSSISDAHLAVPFPLHLSQQRGNPPMPSKRDPSVAGLSY